jgi:DNA polymerase-3 subunit epsilon
MKLNLTRDLCFFDVESTGLNILRDRIIQLAIIKVKADGSPDEELNMLINPGMVFISQEAYEVHGISAKDVANKPTFDKVAKEIYDFIGDSDLAGYNSNRFDVPMLMEEFARAGIDFEIASRRLIDVQRIFYKMEPRTLSAAVKFYCNKSLENAHDAMADVQATIDVFKGQIERYQDLDFEEKDGTVVEKPLRNDMDSIYKFTNDLSLIDVTNRLKYNNEGEVVFNFGKYQNQRVIDVITKVDPNYYRWILEKDFSVQVKRTIKQIKEAYEKQKA